MAAVPSDLYDVRLRRPKVNVSDLIVLVMALIAFGIGWAYKDWHDNRLRTAEVNGVTVAYPRSWLNFPALEPEVFRAVSNDDSREVIFLTTVASPLTDVLQAVTTSSANPAQTFPGYSQLGNRVGTIDGHDAVISDYAYVDASIGGSTIPSVILGQQYAWISNGQLYIFAIEGPEDRWETLENDFERVIDKVEIAG
jgi:hypothetical protein